MKCQNCGNEMEKGFMQATGRMVWTPKLHHLMILFPKNDEIDFICGLIKPCYCSAYLCRKCKKIIMDYGDGISNAKYDTRK